MDQWPEDGTQGRLGDHIFLALDPTARCDRCGIEAIRHGNKLQELYDQRIVDLEAFLQH